MVRERSWSFCGHRAGGLAAAGVLVLLLVLVPARAAAAADAVFTIGAPDGRDAEFALAPGDYAGYPSTFPHDVSFTVGTSTTQADWSYVQPGPKDTWAGTTTHPFAIHFTLSADQVRDQLLTLDYLDTNEFTGPTVQVKANGATAGTVATAPGRGGGVYGRSDIAPQSVSVAVPAADLHAGDNTITITDTAGSWAVYDDVTLAPPGPTSATVLQARPTVFFVDDHGAQRQLLDATVRNAGAAGRVTFTATAGGESAQTVLDLPAGTSTQRLEVPPAPKSGGPLDLKIAADPGGAPFSGTLPYQRRWTVDIIHGSHQDIGYTAIQPTIRSEQDDYIDQAVQACQATKDYPDAARFRWTTEHSWTVQNYLQDRPASAVDALEQCVRSGQFELTGAYDNNLFDLATSEQIYRSLYEGTRRQAELFGVKPDAAIQDDVTGTTWQDTQALADSGVKYLINGANPTRAPRAQTPPQLFWRAAPDGSRVLEWFSSGQGNYTEGYFMLGQPANDDATFNSQAAALAGRLDQVQGQGYPQSVYPLMTLLDNRPPLTYLSDFVKRFDATYTWPKLSMSTPTRFFADIEQEGTSDLPVENGDWSDWWADGAASSARETALNREAQARTASAENLSALATLTTPSADRQGKLDDAYEQEELYTEHTWGAAGLSFDDPEWPFKRAYAEKADALSHDALSSALGDLTAQVRHMAPWPAVVAFNALSWARTGPVEVTVPEGRLAGRPFRLYDGEHAIPYELRSRADGKIALRFVAPDVPAVGYKTFELRPADDDGAGATTQGLDPELKATKSGLENRYYRVTLDPKTGAIASIHDKRQDKELVDKSSHYEVNQFVYRPNCAGANHNAICPTSADHEWTPPSATVKVVQDGPSSATVEVSHDGGAGGATTGVRSITERITLYAGVPRIDIADTVDKERVETTEEAYYAFPFAVSDPHVTYEAPGAPVRFFTDMLPGSSLDWFGIDHYVDVSGSAGGVTLAAQDAPLVEADHIRTQEFLSRPGRLDGSAVDPGPYLPRNGHLYSYVFNNLWMTNYRIAQEGPVTFHYSIAGHAGGFDATDATHFGWGAHIGLQGAAIAGRQQGAYPTGGRSLVSVGSPNVIVQTIKQAYRGQPGLTVRLLEVAGRSGATTLHLPFKVGAAWLEDATEHPGDALAATGSDVTVPVGAHGIVTVGVTPQLSVTAVAADTSVARGESVPVTVALRNDTRRRISGALALDAPAPLSVQPAGAPFGDVAPGETATATFHVAVPASADTGSVTLTARATTGAGSPTPAQLALDVVNPVDVVATPQQPDLLAGRPSTITVTATNNLSRATSASLRVEAPAGWTVTPAGADAQLGAGESRTVEFQVTPPADAFGSATLTAVAATDATTTRVTLPGTVSRAVAIAGTIDAGQHEFALAPAGFGNYATRFPSGVDFTFGRDDPAQAWSYILPGPQDAWAGSRGHSATFRFDLDQVPDHDLTFTAWLVDTQQEYAPSEQVSLNGGSPTQVLLATGGGDGYHWGDGQPNQYGGIVPTRFDVTLPRAQLRAGENAVRIDSLAGSWIVFDAVGVRERP
jgi:hypothetical protein